MHLAPTQRLDYHFYSEIVKFEVLMKFQLAKELAKFERRQKDDSVLQKSVNPEENERYYEGKQQWAVSTFLKAILIDFGDPVYQSLGK